MTYPSGYAIEKGYDATTGNVTEIRHNNQLLWKTHEANALGQITHYEMGNGVHSYYQYDDRHLLSAQQASKNGNIIQNFGYSYDIFANLAARTEDKFAMPNTETFTYDYLNRLTTVTLNGTTDSDMTYDDLGRILAKEADGQAVFSGAQYNTYDQHGNLKPHAVSSATIAGNPFASPSLDIAYTMFDKVKTLSQYDENENLVGQVAYQYGYDHERIQMTHGNTYEKLYLGNCELITQNGNAQWNTFISGPMGVFAAVTSNGTTESLRYIYKDHLGSWTTITDDQGTVLQELSFDAWGNLRASASWSGQYNGVLLYDRGFTGHEHLFSFGLINMNGRMYDPQMSSFLSVDAYVQSPENSQSFNRYTYCMNNPLKYVDPSGWVMVGGMTPGNPFHENWSVNYGVPVHGSSDFNNAYYKLNMALYGNMDGLCGGGPYESGGMGILSSYQAAMKYYQSASPNMVWSFSHLINNYVNNPSVFNRRELLDAGVTDYTYKTWWTAEGQGGYQYSLTLNHGTYNYGSDNYYYGYKGFSDVTIGGMDLSGAKSTDLNKANLLAQTLGVPMGSISEGFEMAAKAYHNVPLLKAKSGLSKPQYVSALTKEGNAILKFHKIAGKACFALSAGIEFVQMIDYHNNGGQDNNVYFKGGLDVVMGLVGLSGPIGFGISMVYFVADFATDGFYGWGKIKY